MNEKTPAETVIKEIIIITIISNGNRTEWSPIRSVIIQVITKSDDRASMITDRIGRHEVLLPINHKNYNFQEKLYIYIYIYTI